MWRLEPQSGLATIQRTIELRGRSAVVSAGVLGSEGRAERKTVLIDGSQMTAGFQEPSSNRCASRRNRPSPLADYALRKIFRRTRSFAAGCLWWPAERFMCPTASLVDAHVEPDGYSDKNNSPEVRSRLQQCLPCHSIHASEIYATLNRISRDFEGSFGSIEYARHLSSHCGYRTVNSYRRPLAHDPTQQPEKLLRQCFPAKWE